MFQPVALLGWLLLSAAGVSAAELPAVTLHKSPQCGCCEGYAAYLRQHGFAVTVQPTHDLVLLQRERGVPPGLDGCHSSLIGGYVVEGHVPIEAILRLLAEKPAIKGISLPGMPAGSPGMSGEKEAPFAIYEIADGPRQLYVLE